MHELLMKLLEERARAVKGFRDLHEEIGTRAMTAEERQEIERRNAELDDLDQRIEQLRTQIARDEAADKAREEVERFIRPTGERREPGQTAEERLLDWFRATSQGRPDVQRSFELPLAGLDVQRDQSGLWEVRSLNTGDDAALIPVTFRRQLYEHLIENSGIRQTRAQIITTASGEAMVIPKALAHPNAGTVTGEGSAIAPNEPTFGQGTLNAYKYTSLVQVSSEMLQDNGVDLIGYLARAFGRALANGSGADMIIGDGSGKPRGVLAAAGTLVQKAGTAAGGKPTADDLIDLFYQVPEPYANNGEWLMRRSTVGEVRKLKDANGQYLWQPSVQAGQPDLILGHPVRTDPNVPAAGTSSTAIAFGDFSTYLIRDVGSVRFERSDDFAFDHDLVTYRAILRTDADLIDETGAIGTFKGGTAA